MTFPFFRRRRRWRPDLFNSNYLDPRTLFLQHYDVLPNVGYVTGIDLDAAYKHLSETLARQTVDCLQMTQYNREAGRLEFNTSYLILNRPCLVEAGGESIVVLYGGSERDFALRLLQEVAAFQVRDVGRRIGFDTQASPAS